jgi:DNA adenine methylase
MTTVHACEPVSIPGRPLLKWAGGKRQLLPALRRFYPITFKRYIEPFFGSGAVFFDLHAAGRLAGRQAWLVDDNADLIGCYRMLTSRTDEVIAHLRLLAAAHGAGGSEFYYEVRDARFNPMRAASSAYTPEMAAMLIYLNRTGFNGLFRLNKAGAFNVPAGRYVNPRIVDESHLRDVAAALRTRGVALVHGSFDGALAEAGKGDFIYCDPPYAPLSRTACFASYTARGFTLNDQARLQQALIAAAERGAHVVLSNSSAPDIERLYSTADARRARLRIERVSARRAINSRAASRGPVTELIVTNVAVPRSVVVNPLRGNRPTTEKLRMAKAGRQAPAIQTSLRQLGHANARRRSASNDT